MRPFTVLLVLATLGCEIQTSSQRDSANKVSAASSHASGWSAEQWTAPTLDSLANDPLGASIRRGHALFVHTRDSLPQHVPSNLNCTSCHLDGGRRATAVPLFGIQGLYPRYNVRADAVVPLEDRINYCMTRSLAGIRLPSDSREMQDLVAYMGFLSRGVPSGTFVMPISLATMPALTGDSSRGATLFVTECARCHGLDGAGVAIAPALWGPRSFSIGASMAREERAASFIRRNMPFDKAGSLSDQQSYDVAAYITSLPRPDMPGKEADWPKGDAPGDVPYRTAGHAPAKSPRLLPRMTPERSLVPPPRSVRR